MGKWTPDYTDDVLHSKIKNLASGAIKRSALESTIEPRITYEDFVQDLDIGDSFTTTLIDILVKEYAERRARPGGHDRRYIANRSARSLQDLSKRTIERTSLPFRRHSRRGAPFNNEYPSMPAAEMDTEEDEESFENMLDNATPLEGVRLNSEIYEAYGTNESGNTGPRPAIPPALIDGASSPPPPPSAVPAMPFGRSGPWSMANPSSPARTLTRQTSIRRSFRGRSTHGPDPSFNDFTSRRRTAARANMARDFDNGVRESVPPPLTWSSGPSSARRFFHGSSSSSRRIDAENRLWGGGNGESRSASPWPSIPSPPSSGAIPLPVINPSESVPSQEWSGSGFHSWSPYFREGDEALTPTLSHAVPSEDSAARVAARRIRGIRTNVLPPPPIPLEELEALRARALEAADERTPTPPIIIPGSSEARFLAAMAAAPQLAPEQPENERRSPSSGPPLVEYPTPRTSHEPDP